MVSGLEDRHKWRNGGYSPSYNTAYYAYHGGLISNVAYGGLPTKVETISSVSHPYKLLGKTNRDLGGYLSSYKATLTLGDSCHSSTLWHNFYNKHVDNVFLTPGVLDVGDLNRPVRIALEKAVRNLGTSKTLFEEGTTNVSNVNQAFWGDSQGRPVGMLGDDAMDIYGTTAIDRTKPTSPAVDLSTALAEFISEGKLLSKPGTSGPAGEWLNYNLAISPLISTVEDFVSAKNGVDKLLEQYERDAGRWIRRRYEFPPENTVETDVLTTRVGSLTGSIPDVNQCSGLGTNKVTKRTYRKVWFSGAFTYPPPGPGWRGRLQELDRVYGIKPGLDTAWELVPFSFVADYFFNFGDVMSNLNAFTSDGLVMPYGYVMCHTIYDYDITWEGGVYKQPGVLTPVQLSANLVIEMKQRQAATPFGFGFDPGSVTARQWSILAALGISAFSS